MLRRMAQDRFLEAFQHRGSSASRYGYRCPDLPREVLHNRVEACRENAVSCSEREVGDLFGFDTKGTVPNETAIVEVDDGSQVHRESKLTDRTGMIFCQLRCFVEREGRTDRPCARERGGERCQALDAAAFLIDGDDAITKERHLLIRSDVRRDRGRWRSEHDDTAEQSFTGKFCCCSELRLHHDRKHKLANAMLEWHRCCALRGSRRLGRGGRCDRGCRRCCRRCCCRCGGRRGFYIVIDVSGGQDLFDSGCAIGIARRRLARSHISGCSTCHR